MTLWRRRVLAALLDGLLVLALALALSIVSGDSALTLSNPAGSFSLELLAAALVVVVLPASLLLSTPGKRLSELRLGARPGLLGRLLVAVKYLLVLGVAMVPWQPYLLLILLLVSALPSAGKRSVLDSALGTLVERRPVL